MTRQLLVHAVEGGDALCGHRMFAEDDCRLQRACRGHTLGTHVRHLNLVLSRGGSSAYKSVGWAQLKASEEKHLMKRIFEKVIKIQAK